MFSCCFCREASEDPDQQPNDPDNNRKSRRKRRGTGRSNVLFELLLLGADGSGKSTFIKQMQLIHGQGFNDNNRVEMIPFVHKNIFDAMEIIVGQMGQLNINLSDQSRNEDIEIFRNEENDLENRLSSVSRLWDDSGVQTCYNRRSEYSSTYPLNVSTKYFLDKIDRINVPGYLPIDDDIIRVRKSTVGVIQYEFTVNDINFKITDVGGEREEREHWIDFLAQRVTCVIFLAAVDEYDTYMETEDNESKNRLKESIELFRNIQQLQWLNHTTFILFLNKKDVFEEKISNGIDLINHFEDFPEGFRRETKPALDFIKRKFTETQPQNRKARMIYTHETEATDTDNMRFVFEAVRDTILQINLKIYNLV